MNTDVPEGGEKYFKQIEIDFKKCWKSQSHQLAFSSNVPGYIAHGQNKYLQWEGKHACIINI